MQQNHGSQHNYIGNWIIISSSFLTMEMFLCFIFKSLFFSIFEHQYLYPDHHRLCQYSHEHLKHLAIWILHRTTVVRIVNDDKIIINELKLCYMDWPSSISWGVSTLHSIKFLFLVFWTNSLFPHLLNSPLNKGSSIRPIFYRNLKRNSKT